MNRLIKVSDVCAIKYVNGGDYDQCICIIICVIWM